MNTVSARIPLMLIALGLFCAEGGAADRKLAQTGFQFLSIAPHARAAAMGDAFTTMDGYSTSIFYNPATMAHMKSMLDASITQNQWIADIMHYAGSISFNPAGGEYGVFGLSILSVNYGEFLGTRVDESTDKGFLDTGVFEPNAYAIGIAYARSLSDRFSVGGHIKYASQTLGKNILPVGQVSDGITEEIENTVDVLAFDFGTHYYTGFKSLAFGMTVRNFSQEIQYQREGFQLPLTFYMGISMNVMDLFSEGSPTHTLMVSIDATHPRDYSERINLGAEYVFMNVLALRAGYLYNYDEQDITAGFGVQKEFAKNRFLAVDYAYTPFGVFDDVQRFTFRVSL